MVTLHAAPTNALTASMRHDLRALLDEAFEGDFSDEDWASTLGGVHVWVSDSGRPLAHGSLVERVLVCSGRALRAGYVEAVATSPSHRRRGHGTAIMKQLGARIHAGCVLGALSTGSHMFYEPLGWERWRGPTFVDGPRGRERTPDDDGGVMVLRTPRSPALDLDGEIVCDWRAGDVW